MTSLSSGSSLRGMIVAAASATILFLGACDKQNDSAISDIRISAQIETRVSGLHFDAGDQIGLTIRLDGTDHCTNTPLAYNGSCFTGSSLAWYPATEKSSEFRAYPPSRTDGNPDRFSLPADQSAGLAEADLLAACRNGVKPTNEAVQMTFRHLMARVDIAVTKAANTASIKQIRVGGGNFASQAAVDWDNLSASALPEADAATVTACCLTADAVYAVILVPQTNPLTVEVELADGKVLRQTRPVTLQSGYRYQLTVQVEAEQLTLTLSGTITEWVDGGSIGSDGSNNSDGSGDEPGQDSSNPNGDPSSDQTETLTYAGEQYRTQIIGGKVWMAEHLRYLPDGATIGNGVWYPNNNEANRATQGLLYSAGTAFAGEAGEKMRGICPQGWHIPSIDELKALHDALGDEACTAFIGEAGYCQYQEYESETYNVKKHYLLSSTTSDSSVYYLKAEAGTVKEMSTSSVIGVSLRCVKD